MPNSKHWIKAQECSVHTQPKNVCTTFVTFAAVVFFSMACFDLAMYGMKACNEHRVTQEYYGVLLINLPYTMVGNCNTVLYDFGALLIEPDWI